MPVAKRKSSEIIDSINKMIESRTRNELALAAIKRDARSLDKTNAYESNLLLGMVYCLEGKPSQSRKSHQIAINYSGDLFSEANAFFANSLLNMGFLSEALKHWKVAYKSKPNDLNVLSGYIECLLKSGMFFSSEKLLSKWDKIQPDNPHRCSSSIYQLANLSRKKEISEDDSFKFFSSLESLFERGFTMLYGIVSVTDDHYDEWASITYYVDESVDDIVKLNAKVANILCESFDAPLLDTFVVKFSKSKNASHFA